MCTDLCHEGSHLQSQLFVHGEVALLYFIIHLVRQQEALSLCLSFHLRSETQPVHEQMKTKFVMKRVFLVEVMNYAHFTSFQRCRKVL